MENEDDPLVGEDYESDGDGEGYESIQEDLRRRAEELRERNDRAYKLGKQAGHAPVLLQAGMEFLFPPRCRTNPKDILRPMHTGAFADCTFGRGGHTREILQRLDPSSKLYAFDIDPTAVPVARDLARLDSRFTFFPQPFAEMDRLLGEAVLDGVLFDIGVSGPQMEDPARGFSLKNLHEGPDRPLDLRMNPSTGVSASEWLTGVSVSELAWVIKNYGADDEDDLVAERTAQAILDEQERSGPFTSMRTFADVIVRARASYEGLGVDFRHVISASLHPARLTVHAIRLFLNQELEQLRDGLSAAFRCLSVGGRCVVNTFKKKEEQILRRFVMDHEEPDAAVVAHLRGQRRRELFPLLGTDLDYSVTLLGKPLQASPVAIASDRRQRSGQLWVMEKQPRVSPVLKATPRPEGRRFVPPVRPAVVGPVSVG